MQRLFKCFGILFFALMLVAGFVPISTQKVSAADSYIEINNIDDLYNVRNNLSGNYRLMADIDMSATATSGSLYNLYDKGWIPIGYDSEYNIQGSFTGTLDGNGHIIKNLRIHYDENANTCDSNNNICVGLFYKNEGVIKNLYLKDCKIYASEFKDTAMAGGVSAINRGTIEKCSFGGTCFAQSNTRTSAVASGISGNNYGIINECFNEGKITASCYVNPYSYRDFAYCYGIAYNVENGEINNCYNTVAVGNSSTADSNKFPISNKNMINCYHTVNSYQYYDDNGISHSLEQVQMSTAKWFTGFDFENTWIIDEEADYKYPQLRNCRQDKGREIDMIELKSAPNKITYKTGDDFDPTGCVVTVLYKDNGSKDIKVTEDMLSGYDMSKAGIQDVTFTHRGYSLSFKISVTQRPEIKDMTLTSEPLKKTFIRGTEFDFTGAIAQIEYKDGTTEDFLIDAKHCTGGDINTSGNYTITYTKFGHSVTFDVSVVPVREEGIHIETLPDKVSYIAGEEIDTTGMKVFVDYNNGTSAETDDYTIEEYDNSEGTQTITVKHGEFEATFEVSFAETKVLSIEVTKQPDKTEYVFGQKFNPKGMVVTAKLDNGKTQEVTDYVVSPMEDRNGMQDLTVSYAGKKTTVTVFVTQRSLNAISITQKPYKLTYIEGSDFDPEGMIVTATYNDDTSEVITDYEMTKLGKTPGNKTIVISFGGKTTTLAVTVVAKEVVNLTVKAPDKVNYIKGEEFDPKGMVVTALYNDGTTAKITDYRVAGFGENDEVNILEISYGGKVENIVVTIHTPDEWEVIKEATCTDAGQRVMKCKECGEVLKTENTAAKGHDFKIKEMKATLTENGSVIKTCNECGISSTTTVYHPKSFKLSKTAYVYTGKALKPSVVVTGADGEKIDASNYTVTYSNNKNVGKATVKIALKGNYSGTKSMTFSINPKATTVSKVKAGKKSFVATWKKQATQTTGYELQYSLKKNFKSGNKTVNIKKNSTVKTTVKKLKSKKTYYARIRTYKTVSGKKYYSSWSKAKAVKVK